MRITRRVIILLALLSCLLLVATVVVSGQADAAADALVRFDQTDAHIAYAGDWAPFTKDLAYSGSYARASSSGSSATVYFTGTRLDWIGMVGTTTGLADVYLDGALKATVDLTSTTASYQARLWSSGSLADGAHSVRIVRDPASASGKYITLDAVDIAGALTSAPPTITSLRPSWAGTSGGTAVVISGTGFAEVSGVTFGDVPAASFTVDSTSQITAITPGHHEGSVRVRVSTAAGATGDSSAAGFAFMDDPLRTRYEQTDPRIAYSGAWSAFAKTAASEGSYGRASSSGASATVYFTGTRLDWIGMKGTTTGSADVYVDGVLKTTVDLSAAAASYQVDVWSTGSLESGPHYVQIVRDPASASGKYLTLDAVDIWGTIDTSAARCQETETLLSYTGSWSPSNTPVASGGSYASANSTASSVAIAFTGSHLVWLAGKSPADGKAAVSLDGAPSETVDLYAPAPSWQQRVWDTGWLAPGRHTVTISWTGAKASAATGTAIDVDAFEVVGTVLPAVPPVDKLSPAQLAGQRVIYSYSGLTPPSSLLSLISKGQAAGVIFFGENISNWAQIKSVCAQLEAANASSTNPVRAPLLLMTDQEGGKIRRLPGGPTLSAKEIGASSDPAGQAAKAGTEAGTTLTSAGMNVNLAPVLDVYRQAGNFIDYTWRSYSSDPAVVSLCGTSFLRAQQSVGPAATAKHFPGLGAAAYGQSTDRAPVTLDVSLDSLRSIDEAPFAAAIGAGVRLVMISWATYPGLDPNAPAGLSSAVAQDELRGRLGFRGVTITDALEAGALQAYGATDNRAVVAAGAGMDLILCSGRSVSQGQTATNGLQAAYSGGRLGVAGFLTAVGRVIDLRMSLGG
jgi:beta-N-acetylhexosaminidase